MTDSELFEKFLENMESFRDDRFSRMATDFLFGKNSYLRMNFKGSSVFNPEWIDKIEDCLYELGQIVNYPREVTTVEGAVVPIELAKKVSYESVQHLASHSQYIKDIDEKGEVIPAKILGLYNKEELHTYENRFIATFIRRLVLFINKRYDFIKNTVNLNEKEILYVKNETIIDGQEVEIETKVTVKREIQDDATIAAKEYIERIEKLKEYVTYYYSSPFMKEFKTEKDVRKPILQTNIIRKNPLYHKCYETFLFIERFDALGVAFHMNSNYQAFSEKERKSLNYILMTSFLFLEMNKVDTPYKSVNKTYKPKLLNSIDDEVFLYGDLVKGPIEFVRCDQGYIDYLNGLMPKGLPDHPNRSERLFFDDEYKIKKNIKGGLAQIEALLARVQKLIEQYEKKFEKLIEERKLEEAEEARRALERLRAYEQSVLDLKRQEIIKAAKKENVSVKAGEKLAKESEKLAKENALKEDVKPVEEKIEEDVILLEEDILDDKDSAAIKSVTVEAINPLVGPGYSKIPISTEPKEDTYLYDEATGETYIIVEEKAKVRESLLDEDTDTYIYDEASDEMYVLLEEYAFDGTPIEHVEEPIVEEKEDDEVEVYELIEEKYIVRTDRGYYVDDYHFAEDRDVAFIFTNFEEARLVKDRFGGRVVKL